MASRSDNDFSLDKKAVAIVLVPILFIGVFLTLFFVVFDGDNTKEETAVPVNASESIDITESEQIALEGLSQQVVNRAGNFGVDTSKVSANNIDEMVTLIETDVDSSDYYFTSRSSSYESVREFIQDDSPADYEDYEEWSNAFETNSNLSFSASNIVAESDSGGSFVTVSGEQLRSASVQVTFDSKETMYVESGSEYGAERSYTVREKNFTGNTATFIFVENSSGEWLLYDVRGLSREFLLSLWNDPQPESFAETQFDFTEVDVLVPPDQNIEEQPLDE